MRHNKLLKKLTYTLCIMAFMLTCFTFAKIDASAVDFPGINVVFDPTDESVIVEGMPGNSADGTVEYRLEGYMNYEGERVETFCYGPSAKPYDVPEKMAYIFNWADAEFILPCSGEYKFTAYVTAVYGSPQGPVEEKGPKTTITITLHKKDESTNWGPGLPNTTVETYDLNQIKGKDKTIKIEEPEYTWTIKGTDIVSVPDKNLSLKVTANPESFNNAGVDEFFGDTLALKLNLEHNGEFGFTAMLDYRIGAEYTGKYANLFYVYGNGNFEYKGGDIVDENGMASFTFTHASDYVIAITNEEYTGQELNPKMEEPVIESEEAPAMKESEEATEPGATVTDEPATEGTVSEESEKDESAEVESEAEPAVDSVPETKPESEGDISEIGSPDGPTVSFTATVTGGVGIWIIVGIVAVVVAVIVTIMLVKKKK